MACWLADTPRGEARVGRGSRTRGLQLSRNSRLSDGARVVLPDGGAHAPQTLMDSIPSYWGPLRADMLRRIGDVDRDAALNRRISPLFHVDAIAAPLLIGHGANDPRVKRAEADQIARAMTDRGITVECVGVLPSLRPWRLRSVVTQPIHPGRARWGPSLRP